jgi:hypothetical protein
MANTNRKSDAQVYFEMATEDAYFMLMAARRQANSRSARFLLDHAIAHLLQMAPPLDAGYKL